MNASKSVWLGLWTAVWCLASTLPARAVIVAVTPPEGTVGTSFTLSGTDFGDKKGKVYLGEDMCKVLSWSDTAVTCEIREPQSADDYTLTLWPQGSKKKNVPQTFSPFTLRRPYIDPGDPMRLITPLEVVTVTGDFFGEKQGRVGMRDTTGLTLECMVLDWSMNAITFEVPEGLTGAVILGVKNEVGIGIQRFWGTFTPIPPVATTTRDYDIQDSHDNASGVFFNNEFWFFYTQKELPFDPKNDIFCRKFDFNTGMITDGPDPEGASTTELAPIVIDHELWLFISGDYGVVQYKRLQLSATDKTYKWEPSFHQIPGGYTVLTPAPVWNPIKNRLEVFFKPADSGVKWVYSDDKGATWSTPKAVAGMSLRSTAPSAVFWRKSETTGVALLAVTSSGNPDVGNTQDTYAKVYAVQDGVVVGATPLWWSPDPAGPPSLAHLGEDYIGLVYANQTLLQVDCAKMDKETGAWSYNPLVPYLDREIKRTPSVAVNLEEHPDTDVPNGRGVRYHAVAYLFWDRKSTFGTRAMLSSIETLGYWKEDDYTDTDIGATANKALAFNLWQVVGVVDAPPYILNGAEYSQDCDIWTCNSIRFGVLQEQTTTMGWDISAGIYFESGEKSPLKLELSETVTEKYEEEKTTSTEVTTTFYRSRNGIVSVFYLAPTFRTHHLQWYDLSGTATNNYLHSMELLGVQYVSQEFDPRGFPFPGMGGMPATYFGSDFPIHASEDDVARVKTYRRVQNDPTWFHAWVNWNRLSEKEITWVKEDVQSKETDFEVKYKIGANVKGIFGMGVEGSFSTHTRSRVKVGNKCTVTLLRGPEDGEPFHGFRADGYWLAPKANAYWVPLNRRDTGDEPWFITYTLSEFDPPLN